MKDAASAVLIAAVEGSQLTPEELRFFTEESPAGVTLFRRNIHQDDPALTAPLIAQLQKSRPPGDPPLMIAVDQEGGRVSRFKHNFPDRGRPMLLEDGRTTHDALLQLEAYGAELTVALVKIGFNVNFAPVVDILTEPTNIGIGDRAFGTTASAVTARASAFMHGLQSSGRLLGCLKHFPGQGHALNDTHFGAAVIDINLQTFLNRETKPFVSLLNQTSLLMMSHSIYPILSELEASRSPVIINDWLRARFGYQGVVLSDDMNMEALPQDLSGWVQALIDTIAAGCDGLLVCRQLDRCYAALDGLRQAAKRSAIFERRLQAAAKRMTDLRSRWQHPR